MTCIAVIPARFGASRFPGKPLAQDTGKYLVQHVYEQVDSCPLIDRVVVATDDRRILDAVNGFGGACVMTRPDHQSGTDRIAEAAEQLDLDPGDLVLNVQGDEPEVSIDALRAVIECFQALSEGHGAENTVFTLAAPFAADGPVQGSGSPEDPNCVKVVVNQAGFALYFSRALIPYPRESGGKIGSAAVAGDRSGRPESYLLHVGVYGFRLDTLRTIARQPRNSRLERCESLEQLRWMDHGMRLRVVTVESAAPGIDTPDDYAAFVDRYRRHAQ